MTTVPQPPGPTRSAPATVPAVARLSFVVFALYAAFGKGFAYAGYPPVFVGEVVLVVLLASVVRPGMSIPRHPAAALTAGLLGIAAIQAVIDLTGGTDPLETARGLAPLYYAGYAYGVFALLRGLERRAGRQEALAVVHRALVRATPGVVVILFLLAALLAVQPEGILSWPVSDVRVLFSKAGDIAVGLALTGAVLAQGGASGQVVRFRWPLVVLWSAAAVLSAFRSRGALLGLAVGGFAMRPRPERLLRGLAAAVVLFAALYLSGLSIRVEDNREVDARSALESLASLAGGTDEDSAGSNYVATRDWRSDWWSAIWVDVNEQAMVLHGAGWSENLAVRYGVVSSSQARDPLVLRLPHNVFFSLAGRAGVVVAAGYVLVPLLTVARSFGGRRGDGPTPLCVEVARAGVMAGTVSAMVDIYFESPQGGILLWALLGMLWWAQATPLEAAGRAPRPFDPAL